MSLLDPVTHEVYAVKFGDNPGGKRGEYYYGSAAEPHDDPMPLNYYVWLIRGPSGDIVLDAGFTHETAARRNRTLQRTPAEGLTELGVDCDRVPYVILSHFHYDHVGCLADFPAAQFVVQDREMAHWTGRYLRRHEFKRLVEVDDLHTLVQLGYDGRLYYVDGAQQIVPGVSVHRTGGHTPGLQVTAVETSIGTVVLAADGSHFFGNVDNDAPFGIVTDLRGMYDTFDTARTLATDPRFVIAGHDPAIMDRFPEVPGLEGIAVQIA